MILRGIVPGWNLPDVSPYVTKLDCYLRLTRTDYTYAPAPADGMQSYAQGKAPCIDYQGRTLGDTSVIIALLERENGLDAHLAAEQKALGHMVMRALEHNVYMQMIQNRWLLHYEQLMQELAGFMRVPQDVLAHAFAPAKARVR